MMKRLILVLMTFGLLGVMPILAAENCDMKIDTEEVASQCDLKSESVRNKNEQIEGEISNSLKKYIEEELKELKENTKEDDAILEELSKR